MVCSDHRSPVRDALVSLAGHESFEQFQGAKADIALEYRASSVSLAVANYIRNRHRVNQAPYTTTIVADKRRELSARRNAAQFF